MPWIYILFLLLTLIAYAGIAFFSYSLKWDMLDCYLPWRYFVGESIQNSVFPLWNPYQHLGYPIHADLRSVFYPEAIIIGFLGGYSIYTLHFLFIFYISLAGLGMYLLAGHFTGNSYARFMAGMAYMLSGFFVSHGQEMFGIIAATWIPYILYFYISLLKHKLWKDFWKLAFFLFLQLTGGYQALSIMLFYLLLVIFLSEAIHNLFHKKWGQFKKLLIQNLILAIIVTASVSVLIITFWQVSPLIGRFGGTTLADAQFMPFSPQSLISLILPFASVKDAAFFDTDLSMNNAYAGMAMIMFYLLSWFRKKNRIENIFWLFGLVCLFAAFGSYTPVRKWLYDFVPMMNLFRMSAFFRYYALISFILIGATFMARLIENPARYQRNFFIAIVLLTFFIGFLTIHASSFIDPATFRMGEFIFSLNQTIATSTRHEHMVVHGLIQLFFLLLLVCGLVLLKRNRKGIVTLLLIFTAIEMTTAVWLNFPVTIGSKPKPKTIHQSLSKMPEGFPLPDLQLPLNENKDIKPELYPLWRNTNIYTKTVSADGFNSFRLDAFENFQKNYPDLFKASLKNPVMFLSDQIGPWSAYEASTIHPTMVWLQDSIYEYVRLKTGNRLKGDTIYLTRFDPGHVSGIVKTRQALILTLMQTNYPGWKVYLNGEHLPHFTGNQLFISCLIPAGSNHIEFRYSNKPVMLGFVISYTVFALIVIVILFNAIQTSSNIHKARWFTIGIFSIMVGLGWLNLINIKSSDQKRLENYLKIKQHVSSLNLNPESDLLVLNVDNPLLMDSVLNMESFQRLYQLFSMKKDLIKFRNKLNIHLSAIAFERLVFISYNLPYWPEADEIIRGKFPHLSESYKSGKTLVQIFDKYKSRTALLHTINDLEQDYPGWSTVLLQRDSTKSFSGEFSWRLDQQQPGSPAFVTTIFEAGIQDLARIMVTAMINLSTGADAALYTVIERDGKNIWQKTSRCSQLIDEPNQWTKIIHVSEPDFQTLPTDIMKVFFWINGKEPLWVDDIEIKVYAAE